MRRRRSSSQLELRLPNTHGGRRRGAGRPKSSDFQSHVSRPRFSSREPLHVTLRIREKLPSLRRRDAFRCLRAAVKKGRERGLAITQFSILSNHVHLIVEAKSLPQLSKQMQGFSISFAKQLNSLMKRTGPVFRERYHLHVLKTPSEVLNALRYVLTNEAKHLENEGNSIRIPRDPFSSAFAFSDWKTLFRGTGKKERLIDEDWPEQLLEELSMEILEPARTWLLSQGWRKAAA